MSLDPTQSLQLAFQNLDAFSVSGIGTFKKVRIPAVIDHQAGKIQPPTQRFILEKGDGLVGRFEDFCFRFHDLSIGDAKELAQKVADHVADEIRRSGKFLIPGIGAIHRGTGPDSSYVLDDLQAAGMGDNPFFGLPSLNLTVNQGKPVQQEQKVEAARRVAAMQGAVVEPAPKPIRGAKPKAKSNALRNLVVVLLLLIMAGSAAAIIWQDKFQNLMQGIGLMAPEIVSTDSVDVANQTASNADAHASKGTPGNAGVDTVGQAVTNTVPEEETQQVDQIPAEDPFIPAPQEEIVNPTDLSAWDGLGEFAKPGVYYLVVGARSDANGARETANQISGAGIKAKVLVPRQEGPHYKVVVFQSADKNAVIKKMVEWKDKFPEKSWIFWPGM